MTCCRPELFYRNRKLCLLNRRRDTPCVYDVLARSSGAPLPRTCPNGRCARRLPPRFCPAHNPHTAVGIFPDAVPVVITYPVSLLIFEQQLRMRIAAAAEVEHVHLPMGPKPYLHMGKEFPDLQVARPGD